MRTGAAPGRRQAGTIAAAGIVALEEGIDRLAEDHENARRLAAGLAGLGLQPSGGGDATNMVFLPLPPGESACLVDHLRQDNILVSGRDGLRLVTHRDVTFADIDTVLNSVRTFVAGRKRQTV